MSHHIYKTEGIVLGSEAKGEASRRLWILTPDLGLVAADARGLRKITSKLRYHLQDFSHIEIDLVRGREIWRVTNARKKKFTKQIVFEPETFKIASNVSKLIKRLCRGEGENKALFDDLVQGLSLLSEMGTETIKARSVEFVLVLRILFRLGYLGDSADVSFFINSPFIESLLGPAHLKRNVILSQINKSLKETQL